MTPSRKDRKRGPYIDPDQYQKFSKLCDKYDDYTTGEVMDELLDCTLSQDGDITASQVNARFDL